MVSSLTKNEEKIDQEIKDLQEKKYGVKIKADIKEYIGINVQKRKDENIEISQPLLID